VRINGTFLTSVAGALFYQVLDFTSLSKIAVAPDWALGFLFGIGGLADVSGARCQKYVPARSIKGILALIIAATSANYIVGFLLGKDLPATAKKIAYL